MARYIIFFISLLLSASLLSAQVKSTDSLSGYEHIDAITVESQKSYSPIGGISDGIVRINMDQSELLPRFAGSADPMRIAQLMPGVQTTVEGNSGFYVRGSDAGASAVLLNNAPLYSFSHLMNFFSSFNPNHIKSFELDKMGSNAAYGYSPGAVFRAETYNRVPDKWSLKGDVGIISSQLTLSVPIGEKVSINLSARRSYTEWLIAIIDMGGSNLDYVLQDYDATLVWDISKKHKLVVNSHFGKDHINGLFDRYTLKGDIAWHNSASSARLQSTFSDNLSMEHTIYYSTFANRLNLSNNGLEIYAPSSISDIGYKGFVNWNFSRSRLRFGVNYAFRDIQAQYMTSNFNFITTENIIRKPHYYSHEAAPYISYRVSITSGLSLEASVRYSIYSSDVAKDDIGGNKRFDYSMPEPSITAEYRITRQHRVMAGYSYGAQYIHLVPQSNTSFSTDFWEPATADLLPMLSHNASIGYYASLLEDRLKFSVEGYYRFFDNVVECNMPIMTLIHSVTDIEDYIYSGIGEAYGVELMALYSSAKWTCMLGYTLGYSVRQFEQINDGNPFPAKQDRRHDLSISVTWRPHPRWDVGAVFVYATGAPYTSPVDFYTVAGAFLKGQGTYNGARLPDYHRLDLSATCWLGKLGEHRHGINLSIYNCYGRRNPIYISWPIYANENNQGFNITQNQHYLYTILPSISYIFRFGQ